MAQYCNQCGSPLGEGAKFCSYCGNSIIAEKGPEIKVETQHQAYTQPQYEANPQQAGSPPVYHPAPPQYEKDRMVAGILAILIGGLGIHKFYLGKIGNGIIFLLFCWTGIPSIVGLIEGIIYLTESDEAFQQRVKDM